MFMPSALSCDGSVVIAMIYGLDGRGSFTGRGKFFLLSAAFRQALGITYLMSTGGKAAGV
jgi:hypothetical protein